MLEIGRCKVIGSLFLGTSEQITYPQTHGERLALADRYAVLPAGSHRAARRAGILFLCRCVSAWFLVRGQLATHGFRES